MPQENLSVLVFEVGGSFAHFKRIFATTSAMTYPIPAKTAVYGLIGAIIGLEKEENDYLRHFANGRCRIALQLLHPVRTQRVAMNLRPDFGSNAAEPSKKNPYRQSGNRKPTLFEFVHRPRYRLYVAHEDQALYDRLHDQLRHRRSVYTPTLGLANCLATIDFITETKAEALTGEQTLPIDSVVPKSRLRRLTRNEQGPNRLLEVGQYAVEMEPTRDVTVREDIILDRDGRAITATVSGAYSVNWDNRQAHVIFF